MLDELATLECTACESAIVDTACQVIYETPAGGASTSVTVER